MSQMQGAVVCRFIGAFLKRPSMGKLQVCEQHSDEGNAADGHFSA